jgi:hypothetical protein
LKLSKSLHTQYQRALKEMFDHLSIHFAHRFFVGFHPHIKLDDEIIELIQAHGVESYIRQIQGASMSMLGGVQQDILKIDRASHPVSPDVLRAARAADRILEPFLANLYRRTGIRRRVPYRSIAKYLAYVKRDPNRRFSTRDGGLAYTYSSGPYAVIVFSARFLKLPYFSRVVTLIHEGFHLNRPNPISLTAFDEGISERLTYQALRERAIPPVRYPRSTEVTPVLQFAEQLHQKYPELAHAHEAAVHFLDSQIMEKVFTERDLLRLYLLGDEEFERQLGGPTCSLLDLLEYDYPYEAWALPLTVVTSALLSARQWINQLTEEETSSLLKPLATFLRRVGKVIYKNNTTDLTHKAFHRFFGKVMNSPTFTMTESA